MTAEKLFIASFDLSDEQIAEEIVQFVLQPTLEQVTQIDIIAIHKEQRKEQFFKEHYCVMPVQINPSGTLNFNQSHKLQLLFHTTLQTVGPTKITLEFKLKNGQIQKIDQDLIEVQPIIENK